MPLLILIADDDPNIRLAISDYLELCGYSVITAENGLEALSFLEKYHPHLLISDIKMPQQNGYDLVKEVRKLPEFRLLPVIFLTERNSTEARIQGYQVGCDLYLPKPFVMEELSAIIRNLLERSQIIQTERHFSESESTNNKTLLQPKNNPLSLNLCLTKREKQVLNLVANGLSNINMAEKLYLSPRTVEKYVSNLLRKTETNNRSELVRFALDNNLVD